MQAIQKSTPISLSTPKLKLFNVPNELNNKTKREIERGDCVSSTIQ